MACHVFAREVPYSHKVNSSIKTASDVGDVDVKGELVPEELEHLVVLFVLHEVHAGAHVGAVLMVGDIFQAEGASVRLDAVLCLVINTVEAALFSAGVAVSADALVPLASLVAVGGALNGVPFLPLALSIPDQGVRGRLTSIASCCPGRPMLRR